MTLTIAVLSFAAGFAAGYAAALLIPKVWGKLRAWLVVKLS